MTDDPADGVNRLLAIVLLGFFEVVEEGRGVVGALGDFAGAASGSLARAAWTSSWC
jgi:hypothetical protein